MKNPEADISIPNIFTPVNWSQILKFTKMCCLLCCKIINLVEMQINVILKTDSFINLRLSSLQNR